MKITTQLHVFTKTDLEQMGRFQAMARIVGKFLRGSVVDQKVRWTDEGLLEVISEVAEETTS